MAFDLSDPTFDAVREAGWKPARTGAGEARVAVGPHVTATVVDGLLAALDRAAERTT